MESWSETQRWYDKFTSRPDIQELMKQLAFPWNGTIEEYHNIDKEWAKKFEDAGVPWREVRVVAFDMYQKALQVSFQNALERCYYRIIMLGDSLDEIRAKTLLGRK